MKVLPFSRRPESSCETTAGNRNNPLAGAQHYRRALRSKANFIRNKRMAKFSTSTPRSSGERFPRKAWRHIAIDTPDTLELFGGQHRGYLKVTLSNDSKHLLDPRDNANIAFSFRILDSNGEVLAKEGTRTPLRDSVAPGTKYTQIVNVAISPKIFEAAAAIRVGLLDEGRYWVESLYPKHPREVQLKPGAEQHHLQAQVAAGGQIWGRGKNNRLRWPYNTMMVSERHKLLYVPIAKCGCTSLKSMMAELAGVERGDVPEDMGIHFITDKFNTGVQLKDKPMDLAREILASDQYFKFSVIRDPFERLVSAYMEKFVYKRENRHNLSHTRPVISAAQGTDDIDLHRGISFDDFAHYIVQQDPYDLDPHWRPQNLYLLGMPHMSQIFRLENIAQLETYLQQKLGVTAELGHVNATRKSDTILPEASRLTADTLDKQGAIHPDSFLSSQHAESIRQYYQEDFRIYSAAE
jgi:hypothetical protein